jgi:hypothetical protein
MPSEMRHKAPRTRPRCLDSSSASRWRACASRLEWGFVDRVVVDYPGVVERMVARCYRTLGRLN